MGVKCVTVKLYREFMLALCLYQIHENLTKCLADDVRSQKDGWTDGCRVTKCCKLLISLATISFCSKGNLAVHAPFMHER